MPLFIDVHEKAPEGAKAKDVADAHMADQKVEGKYGVRYINYWFDEKAGKIFQPMRVALTGLSVSPGIFEVLVMLGRDRSLSRIDAALALLRRSDG